ncbi:MAG: methyltransferase, partial [Candidatus Brocadiia bacterium]
MTGKERIQQALSHAEPDRVPMDFGATATTGIAASVVYRLRKALGLNGPVKVTEPYQMLGEVDEDLRRELGIDAVGVNTSKNMFGFRNENWKPWTLFDGTPVLVPGKFNTEPDENGDILMYPEGDRSVPPSARMPEGGFYFDSIVRQPPIDEDELDVEDNLEEFGPISEEELDHLRKETERLKDTGAALVGNFADTGFGDIALVPAPFLKHPKGIRDVEEWYVSTVTRREYVRRVFEGQCEAALENLPRIHEVVGEDIDV